MKTAVLNGLLCSELFFITLYDRYCVSLSMFIHIHILACSLKVVVNIMSSIFSNMNYIPFNMSITLLPFINPAMCDFQNNNCYWRYSSRWTLAFASNRRRSFLS